MYDPRTGREVEVERSHWEDVAKFLEGFDPNGKKVT